MKREFAINIGLLLIANLFIKAFYLLGIDRQMQLEVGTETYGLYYNLLNVTLIFQFINDFGIQNYTSRYVSQNRDQIKLQYKDFAGLKISLSVFYMIALFVFVWIMNYSSGKYLFIFHLACNQILVSGIFFVRSNISGLGFYKTDSFFSILDRMLLIVLGSLLLWSPFFKKYISIDAFVWIQTISLCITLFSALLFIRTKHLSFSFFSIELSEVKKILRACLPFAMIYLFSSLYNKIDVILLGKLLEDGNKQAGIYAGSMRLFEACSMISLAFGSLLLAMFSALYMDSKKLQELFRMAMNALLVITLCIVLSSVFYSKEIMNLLYHQSDEYWTYTFRFIMIAFLPASLNYIYGAFFQAIHKEIKLLQYYGIASVISFVLNLIIIPQWQVIGSSCIAILTHAVLFLIQVYYTNSNKLLKQKLRYSLEISMFVLSSVCLMYLFQMLPVNWIIKMSLASIGIIFIAFLMKIIAIRDFVNAKVQMK